MPHHEHLQYLVQGHPRGAEVSLFKKTSGTTCWQTDYGFPEVGLSLHFLDFANPEFLGQGISIYPYGEFHLVKAKKSGLRLRTGASVGYFTKVFDPVSNFKNNAIASHLNCFINLRLSAFRQLSNVIRLDYGLGLSHFSNGAYRTPNLGINTLEFTIGLSHIAFLKTPVPPIATTDSGSSRRFELVILAGGSRAEIQPPTRTGYAAWTLSAAANWVRTNKSRWVLGMESGYHGGNKNRIDIEDPNAQSLFDKMTIGIKGGYAQRVGKIEFPFEFGYYLHSRVKANGSYFQRIGVRYYFHKRWMANLTLKTHWAVADHWEFGGGYIIGTKRK